MIRNRCVAFTFHDVYRVSPSESGFPGRAAERYKLDTAAFDVQLKHLAAIRDDPPVLVTDPLPSAPADVPFAMTVDDGGVSASTVAVERFEALGWRMHCFVTTAYIGKAGFLDHGQIRALRARGHVIGTHSATHPQVFSACSWNEMIREWRESCETLSEILGERVTIGSMPGGAYSAIVAKAANTAGLKVLFTSEPETRVRLVEGCTVIGRFTIHASGPPDFAGRLARLDTSLRVREWTAWQAKKLAKSVVRRVPARRHNSLVTAC